MAPGTPLTLVDLRGLDDLDGRLPRPEADDEPLEAVRAILDDVKVRGDAALRDCTERFDGVTVTDLRVDDARVRTALEGIDTELRDAMEAALDAIVEFHRAQLVPDRSSVRDGISVAVVRRAVDRAGLYVPGGRAVYPSTVLMTAVPARVAGVGQVALCVPPSEGGEVPEATLAAAALAGVDEVYRVGGAQAIGALAYGTESISSVDVIAGPGNIYVAVAKREVAGVVGVPSAFAGPSEVVVVADETTPTDFAAIDLVVQAEHGPGGLAWLITWSDRVAADVGDAVGRLAATATRRADIEATLAEGGYAVLVDGPEQALEVVNLIAPEHLELMCADPQALVAGVRHAGAVFCGALSPASVGDYLAGPSHVLPTFGSARFAGALTVDDFQKPMHVVAVDAPGLRAVAPHVVALARAEGLDCHAESILVRQQ